MKQNPLVSFCIATYKRQELLRSAIASVLRQDYDNLEIIISDNDPKGSAQKVATSFKSKLITYHRNKENVGMVNNFNAAFKHSHGDYIVLLSDDDLVEPQMVKLLMKLRDKYPQAGSYFGAPYYLVKDPLILRIYHLTLGKNSQINKTVTLGAMNIISPEDFLPKFLKHEIFTSFFWSCGMVRRDVFKKAGGFKTLYGSNFLTDSAYLLRIGTVENTAIINKEVGSQLIHRSNFGRKDQDLLTLKNAVKGFYEQSVLRAKKTNCQSDLENFLSHSVSVQLLDVFKFRRITHQKTNRKFFVNIFNDIASEYPFFKKDYFYFYSRTFFPVAMKSFENCKWIFEKRNLKLLRNKLLKLIRY